MTSQKSEVLERAPSLDLNNTDFFGEWNYEKLVEYRTGLMMTIASLTAQHERADMLERTGKEDPDHDWIKRTHFSLTKAKMFYDEVIHRLRIMDAYSFASSPFAMAASARAQTTMARTPPPEIADKTKA